MACNKCDSIKDVSDVDGPYTVRTCDGCGREIKYREFGKHGIGLEIRAGSQVVIPANFLQISANPLKSTGHLTRSGVAWFAEHVFLESIPTNPEHFQPFLDKLIEQLDQYLRRAPVFQGFDFDDPSQSEAIFDRAAENKNSAEWYAYVAALLFTLAKEAISANNAVGAASAMAGAERFRSLWIFKINFEEVVWMGQSAKKLTDVLALWKANEANAIEEFWQIKLQEASYVFSQLFSVPVTFIQDKAYVGGQQIDGKSSRFVDFLFSGGASGEAMLIEIKTPVTRLLQQSKYRSNVYAPDTALSGSVIQAADYRHSVTRDLRAIGSLHVSQC